MPKIRNKLKFKYQSGNTPIVPATSAESLIHIAYPDPFGTSSSPFWDHVVNTNTGSNRSFEVIDAEGNKVTFFLDPNTSNHIDTTTSSNKTIGIGDISSDIKDGLQSGLDDLRAKISESINADPTLNITAQPDNTSPYNKVKFTYTPGSSGNGVKFNNVTLSNLYFFFTEATGGTDQSGNDPIFSYEEKSGNLTKLTKNILKVKDSLQGTIPIEKSIDSKGYPSLNLRFDDNKTVVYNTKNVDLITKTELNSYMNNKKNSKLVSTPNVFNFEDFSKSFETKSLYYDDLLEKENLEIENKPYDDNNTFFENKSDELKGENEIVINLSFEKDCFLINNMTPTQGNSNDTINIGNDTHRPFKSPTAYFNFKNNRWDYLGDIEESSYSEPSVEKQNICFGGLSILKANVPTINNNTNKYPGSFGKPIDTYGFPYDVRYHGLEDHFINISDYIDKDFILKKVVFDGVFSSSGNGAADYGNFISLNNVGFFLLNQRENFDSQVITNDDLNTMKNYRHVDSNDTLTTASKNINFIDQDGSIRKFSFLNDSESGLVINKISGLETAVSKPSQRDLITYNSLVNYSSGSLESNNSSGTNGFVDYEKIKKEADFFKEISSNNVISNIDYTRERITLSSKVKSPVKQDEVSIFSHNEVIIGNKFGTRTGFNLLTGRSSKQENYVASSTNKFIINYNQVGDIEFNVYKDVNTEDSYILKKEDKIILGVSLTNSLGFYDTAAGASDIFAIHNLKVKLIGSYERKNIPLIDYNHKHITSNSIKKSVIGNTRVVDKYITTPIQLMKRNYINRDLSYHGIGSEYVNIDNLSSNTKSLTRVVKLIEDDKEKDIYDSAVKNILEVINVDNKKLIELETFWDDSLGYTNPTNINNIILHVPNEKSSTTEFENNIWEDSYPFEEKYRNLNRPIKIDYKSLGLNGIMPSIREIDSTTLDYSNIIEKDLNKYFYSFNKDSTTRMPLVNIVNSKKTIAISGFKLGIFHPERIKRTIRFNSINFGNFCDMINYHRNYVLIDNEGEIERTIDKKFIDMATFSEILENNLSQLQITYNKNKYSEITKPFIDKDINSINENNSIP